MSRKSLKSIARGKALGAVLVVAGIVVAEVIGVILMMLLDISDSIVMQIIPEGMGALAAVMGVVLLGGSKMLKPSLEDVAHTFRFAWWCLVVTFALLVFDVIIYVTEGTAVNPDWLAAMVKLAVFCLLIGIFEEYLFRGVVFQALLGLLGGTHRGVIRAVVLTSVAFGMAHVSFDDFGNGLSVVQALLKIVQTGLYSVLLCTIVLHTRKLGGVSLFHGFDDFVVVTPGIAFFNESLDIDYVVQGDGAIPTIMYYLLVIGLYLPFVVKSFREIEREQYVYRGVFMEEAVAEFELEQERARQDAEREAQMAAAQIALPAQGDILVPQAQAPVVVAPSASVPNEYPRADQPPYPRAPEVQVPCDRGGRPPVPKGL